MSKAKKPPAFIGCTLKTLPDDLLLAAARAAVAENPANAPPVEHVAALLGAALVAPQHIAVMTSKYWGPQTRTLSVQFLDSPTAACRKLILAHMNAWGTRCGVGFAETTGTGQVRVARQRGQGYWSYLGTDILGIPAGQPTMNLEAFTESTPDSEYRRVVRHETGHTLGCPHEHMRRAIVALLDPNKTIGYFQQTQGWSRQTVIQQVLTPVEESSLMGPLTAPEQDSIMCYQLPGSITLSGRPIVGGVDITEDDFAYMARLYPKPAAPPSPPVSPPPPPPAGQGQVVVDLDAKTVSLPAGFKVA